MPPPTITVFGAGSWGTALAILLARNGISTVLWSHNPEHAAQMRVERQNLRYLPASRFPPALEVTADFSQAVRSTTGAVLVAVPSHAFRETVERLPALLSPDCGLIWATKGLDPKKGCLLHEVAIEILGTETALAVLSGPTFAAEVAAGLPSALTVASISMTFANRIVSWLHNTNFRAYTSDDIVGVQLGGASKNVLAIAAGVADGLGYGANARAALITRGLAEMMRLGIAMGARMETLTGLAGVGDLILTATDNQSRNRRFGLGLGQGKSRATVSAEIGQEIEGILTAKLVNELALRYGVEMPITTQVYRILYEGLTPAEAVNNLLLREPKPERIT
jgi:glycerol-3-phosphate dehydrogenase (NAD(P)+)